MKNKKYLVFFLVLLLLFVVKWDYVSAGECGKASVTHPIDPTLPNGGYIWPGSPPTANLCDVGYPSTPKVGKYRTYAWEWGCGSAAPGNINYEVINGNNLDCFSYVEQFQPWVNGICGSANGDGFSSAPVVSEFFTLSKFCLKGSFSGLSGSGPWTWSCIGTGGGSTASCSAQKLTTAGCGSSDGGIFTSAPTLGLCDNSSSLSGSIIYNDPCLDWEDLSYYSYAACSLAEVGNWEWSCIGQDGVPVSCGAQKQPADNNCAASTCNNTQCFNNTKWVTGTKNCVPNNCAANTCSTTVCHNGINWVTGTKNCVVVVDDDCSVETCMGQLCFDIASDGWVPGIKNCIVDNLCAADICSNANCFNGIQWVTGIKPQTYSQQTCISLPDAVDCSLAADCGKQDITTAICTAKDDCTGSLGNIRPLSECGSSCVSSTTQCAACPAPLTINGWREVSP
ncbi:MAG: hypothetical protein US70_C0031G0003 [Parcubacteria group bacterium GW2011_GWD2_38_11]|nr:MAG: hypothetical protein US70_C0031G0003 [Parcubacteria group bacterium GW2011_GWD2_38_11]